MCCRLGLCVARPSSDATSRFSWCYAVCVVFAFHARFCWVVLAPPMVVGGSCRLFGPVCANSPPRSRGCVSRYGCPCMGLCVVGTRSVKFGLLISLALMPLSFRVFVPLICAVPCPCALVRSCWLFAAVSAPMGV